LGLEIWNLELFTEAPNLKKQISNKSQMSNSNSLPSATGALKFELFASNPPLPIAELTFEFFLSHLFGS